MKEQANQAETPGVAVEEKMVTISSKEYESLKTDLDTAKGEISRLEYKYNELLRMFYGPKSEKNKLKPSDPAQLELFAREQVETADTPTPEKETISYERPRRKGRPVRSKLPEELERVEEVIEPESIPEGAVKIGEERTELLEFVPSKVYVRVIIRPKYVIPGSEGRGCVVVAPMPTLPIPKGVMGGSLLAHVCVSKFIDHLPFYRQAQIFKREKIPLPESTLKGGFAATCRLLEPLYERLKEKIFQSDYIQADESPIPVLTADKPGATHKGYMWVANDPRSGLACFFYNKSRSQVAAGEFLGSYHGALQTDGYAVYNGYAAQNGALLLACMTHCRRKFEHAKNNNRRKSEEALALFAKLYAVEEKARQGEFSPEQRQELRQEQSLPAMAELKAWLEKSGPEVLPSSPIGVAISYTLNVWQKLEAIFTDGKYEIDNNLIENRIRPLALGRKNYLFAGSHGGARCNAMMYSFFACCKQAQVNPREWLTDVLNRIPEHKANRLDELLPTKWKKSTTIQKEQ
jgi:transposase